MLYITVPLKCKFNLSLCVSFCVSAGGWAVNGGSSKGFMLPRAQLSSSSRLHQMTETTFCSCPLRHWVLLERKMWHFIIIYVYVCQRACQPMESKQWQQTQPSPLPSPLFFSLPRGNWWRYPTMPEHISSCWLVGRGGVGGDCLSLCSPRGERL